MADFKESYANTVTHELGYVDHPDDAGGETYNGIARKFHPNWEGWVLIDEQKGKDDFPNNLPNKTLAGLQEAFYRNKFWDKLHGDQLPDQDLANHMFSVAVNASVHRSVSYLQRALNVLNRQERDYRDLIVDGVIGMKTFAALNAYLQKREVYGLLAFFNAQYLTHWMDRAEKIESQEEFTNGIANRVVSEFKYSADKFYLA